jgi:hypothetical protein
MKNKKIEQLFAAQRAYKKSGKFNIPEMVKGSGIYSYSDYDYKFTTSDNHTRRYCDFDFFYGGRCYLVSASNRLSALHDAAHMTATKFTDKENFPEFITPYGDIDFIKMANELPEGVFGEAIGMLFGDEDYNKLIATRTEAIFEERVKEANLPEQSIQITFNKKYVFINTIVDCEFRSYEDVYKLRDALLQYLKSRNLTEYFDATRYN